MFGFRFVVLRENAHTTSRVLSEPCTKGKYNPFCKPGFYVLNATPAKHCKNRRTPAGLFLQAAYHQCIFFHIQREQIWDKISNKNLQIAFSFMGVGVKSNCCLLVKNKRKEGLGIALSICHPSIIIFSFKVFVGYM